ncbi:DUF1439 domain-containing protein [Lysobacter brunescens]|uniref:DUF1439 domain-containing protein n=1 Tax=Lysobacter brunescens TaxID=262323 RepID=A0ABW2YCC7_9GAMM
MIARRRTLLRAALLLATTATLAACGTLDTAKAVLLNQVSFTPAQLQAQLDKHYPRQYDQLGGLVTLSVMNPQVAIPPDSTRLHLDFDIGIEGLGMRSDRPAGHIALTSGLRYDPRSNALYMEEPTLESAELPLLGGRMNATGRDLINGWLRDYARAEPVYRLDAETREKLGERRIAGTLIRNQRVVIELDR